MFTLANGAAIENLTMTDVATGDGFVFARMDYAGNRSEWISWRLDGYSATGELLTYSGQYSGMANTDDTEARDRAAIAYGVRVRSHGVHVG